MRQTPKYPPCVTPCTCICNQNLSCMLINNKTFLEVSTTCADPGSFVRGGTTLTLFSFFSWWGEWGSKLYQYKRATIGPPAKRHLNDVSLANIECLLGSFVIFQGIRTWIRIRIAKEPYMFVKFFRGRRSGPPVPLWIHPCTTTAKIRPEHNSDTKHLIQASI